MNSKQGRLVIPAVWLWAYLLAGCDDTPKTYSSCILKGATAGGGNYATLLVAKTCEDKFKAVLAVTPKGSAYISSDSGKPLAVFKITNQDANNLILHIQIDFMVLDAPGGKQIDAYLFSFATNIRPGMEEALTGNLPAVPKAWAWGIAKVEGVNVR